MNKERFYIIEMKSTNSVLKLNECKKIFLLKGISSFADCSDKGFLINSDFIIDEKGDTMLWCPIYNMRYYTFVSIKIEEFKNLKGAKKKFSKF